MAMPPRKDKACGKYRVVFPPSGFYSHTEGPSKKRYYSSYCRTCHISYTSKRREDNYDRYSLYEAEKRLRRNFNLSLKEYDAMFQEQDGRCAICLQKETRLSRTRKLKRLAVDHDHDTGQIRQLLCHSCNCGLGQFKESPVLLKEAINYLKHWKATDYKDKP